MPSNSLATPRGLMNLIHDFVAHSSLNALENKESEPAFENPIVGFAKGDDPIFMDYKEHVGEFHLTPAEVFNLTFPDLNAAAEDLTVISWVLPHIEATRRDNRHQTEYPAERWARGRIFGEKSNEALRKHVVEALKNAGIPSVAPLLSPHFERKDSDRFTFASTWSERHMAYAAGQGTFGLCDGLITPHGKAMRTGSVVARITVPPTPRPYTDHHRYCLFFSKGKCGKCITRCPADALSESGHDKVKCRNHIRPKCAEYVKENYKFDGFGCGLCQTLVPCESRIPDPAEAKAWQNARAEYEQAYA
jgi:epoxyqueuosine reductase